jgi:hypothetical protein
VTPFCDWKSLNTKFSSVLTVNLLHISTKFSSTYIEPCIEQPDESSGSGGTLRSWFGGTFYFKICIDFSYKQLGTMGYSAAPKSLSCLEKHKKRSSAPNFPTRTST